MICQAFTDSALAISYSQSILYAHIVLWLVSSRSSTCAHSNITPRPLMCVHTDCVSEANMQALEGSLSVCSVDSKLAIAQQAGPRQEQQSQSVP